MFAGRRSTRRNAVSFPLQHRTKCHTERSAEGYAHRQVVQGNAQGSANPDAERDASCEI
jgi:hypothetical protein